MSRVTSELETTLGPGTSELDIRIGLHSGPVTAGVLRGDKSRFQLFGDTMNTASRMETTGQPGRVQVSEATAALLEADGKPHWMAPREEVVQAKGKGAMRTFWLLPRSSSRDCADFSRHLSTCAESTCASLEASISFDTIETSRSTAASQWGQLSLGVESHVMQRRDKVKRLVDWISHILSSSLQKLYAQRQLNSSSDSHELVSTAFCANETSMTEIVAMPRFNASRALPTSKLPALEEAVVAQLQTYVHRIAEKYGNHPFRKCRR